MYKVTTIFYDNGKVIARLSKEGDCAGEFDRFDCYIDEFETMEEATAFIKESKKA